MPLLRLIREPLRRVERRVRNRLVHANVDVLLFEHQPAVTVLEHFRRDRKSTEVGELAEADVGDDLTRAPAFLLNDAQRYQLLRIDPELARRRIAGHRTDHVSSLPFPAVASKLREVEAE